MRTFIMGVALLLLRHFDMLDKAQTTTMIMIIIGVILATFQDYREVTK